MTNNNFRIQMEVMIDELLLRKASPPWEQIKKNLPHYDTAHLNMLAALLREALASTVSDCSLASSLMDRDCYAYN
jgi:hypothetical protein